MWAPSPLRAEADSSAFPPAELAVAWRAYAR